MGALSRASTRLLVHVDHCNRNNDGTAHLGLPRLRSSAQPTVLLVDATGGYSERPSGASVDNFGRRGSVIHIFLLLSSCFRGSTGRLHEH